MFASSFNRRQFALRLGLWGALPAVSRAQSRLGDQVHIAPWGGEELPYLPLAVADALGFFHEEGLDVQIQYHPSGMQAERE
jgi:NitT/TauT family transport system substrate-binding protein